MEELPSGYSFLLQPWLSKVVEKLPDDQKDEFKAKAQPAFKFLLGKIKELQLWVPHPFCLEQNQDWISGAHDCRQAGHYFLTVSLVLQFHGRINGS